MPATSTTIRDAVVAALNAAVAEPDAVYPAENAPFRFGFEAEGKFVVNVNLPEGFTGLSVPVICTSVKSAPADRDTDADTVVVEIGILKRIDRAAAAEDEFAEVGDLVEFAEQIRDWIRRNPIDGAELANDPLTLDPLYDHDLLSKAGLFAAVVKVPILAQFEN